MAYFVYRTHCWEGDYLVVIDDKPPVPGDPNKYFPYYVGERKTYNDPREAVEAAIRIRDEWRSNRVGKIDPTPEDIHLDCDEDGDDDAGTREWAERVWEQDIPVGN